MENPLKGYMDGLLQGMKLGTVLVFSRLDNASMRKAFVGGLRYMVARTRNTVSPEEQRRIVGLLLESTQQVLNEMLQNKE